MGSFDAYVRDCDGRPGEPDALADGRGGADGRARLHRQRGVRRGPAHRGLLHRRHRPGASRGLHHLARGLRGPHAHPGRHRAGGLALGRPELLAVGQGAVRRDHGGEGRRLADPGLAQPRGGGEQP